MERNTLKVIDANGEIAVGIGQTPRNIIPTLRVIGIPKALSDHLRDSFGGNSYRNQKNSTVYDWTASGNTCVNFLLLYKEYLPSLKERADAVCSANWTRYASPHNKIPDDVLKGRYKAFVDCLALNNWRNPL